MERFDLLGKIVDPQVYDTQGRELTQSSPLLGNLDILKIIASNLSDPKDIKSFRATSMQARNALLDREQLIRGMQSSAPNTWAKLQEAKSLLHPDGEAICYFDGHAMPQEEVYGAESIFGSDWQGPAPGPSDAESSESGSYVSSSEDSDSVSDDADSDDLADAEREASGILLVLDYVAGTMRDSWVLPFSPEQGMSSLSKNPLEGRVLSTAARGVLLRHEHLQTLNQHGQIVQSKTTGFEHNIYISAQELARWVSS